MKLTVIIPMYNEESIVESTLREVGSYGRYAVFCSHGAGKTAAGICGQKRGTEAII